MTASRDRLRPRPVPDIGERRRPESSLRQALFLALLAIPLAGPLLAQQTLRNESGAPVTLRVGPSAAFPEAGRLAPGQVVSRGRCDGNRRWCLVSTDSIFGWVDVTILGTPRGLPPPSAVTVTTLPDPGTEPTALGARPLPPEILQAVPRAALPVPGARPPFLLSVTEPMRNVTPGLVNLRAGPGTEHPVLGTLAPGQGGVIDLCDRTEQWCRIAPTGGPRGWVKMTFIGVRRI
jgi:uncharacterized protein YraI